MNFPPLSLFEPGKSVTASLALNPNTSVKSIKSKLFPKVNPITRLLSRFQLRKLITHGREFSEEELEEVRKRGSFNFEYEYESKPSKLFLQIYADVLACLTRDSLAGVVSPSLIGSNGVIVCSIVSVIPDILAHYARLIVKAEKEILLQTNYWQPSISVNTISDALKELSKRVEKRNGEKVVVKIIWDRGSWKQIYSNHVKVDVATYTAQDLPKPEEIPFISLEVINFHRPILGTFHQKLLIIDRKVACLNSNNIQDRPNVEMMIHLEGQIVDSLYDTALISWSKDFFPPLACLQTPSPTTDIKFGKENIYLKGINIATEAKGSRKKAGEFQALVESSRPWWDGRHDHPEIIQTSEKDSTKVEKNSNFRGLVHRVIDNHRNNTNKGEEEEEDSHPEPANTTTKVTLSNSSQDGSRLSALSSALNAGAKQAVDATVDESALDNFKPLSLHEPHESVPIVMCNRKPHGLAGHQDIRVPQDAAWLGALLYSKRNVFIQTPTFNAKPLQLAVLQACRRGIQVELWLDPGFNDQSESLLFQGGTNEQVVVELYSKLIGKDKDNLLVYWYVAKDQTRPINALVKSRNIHVKFLSCDGEIGIIGNGNMDTQSFFHSQECNIMIDSKQIVTDWMNMLRCNQSTLEYGKVDQDGIWRGSNGEEMAKAKKVGVWRAIMGLI